MPKVKVKYTFPSGRKIDLFYVGVLAEALGRTRATIRRWEIAGIIPESGFKDEKHCRLYTKEQIDVIVTSAEKAHIRQGDNLSKTPFTKLCWEGMKKLKEEYEKESKNG